MKTWERIKEKLTSRKFWLTLIGVGAGIAQLCGADGNTVELICGAALAIVPSVIYIIMEGKIDAEGAKRLALSVSEAIDTAFGERKTDASEDVNKDASENTP